MKLSVFETINDLIAQLKKLEPMNELYRKKLDDKLRLEFNYNSNHIEGNTLTYEETKQLIFKDLTSEIGHAFREYDEMKAHDAALLLVKQWASETEIRPLNEQSIKNLNALILIKPFWKDAITPDGKPTRREIQVGDYKKFPNSVRLDNGELFEYATPAETPILMGELINWYRHEIEKNELPAVAISALFYYKFVQIHPFDVGNGRIARLLMNYILFCFGLPPVVVKSADKTNYLRALQRADAGDIEAFVEYVAEQLVWSLELSIKAAKGESVEEAEVLDKQIELLKRKVKAEKILELVRSEEVISKYVIPELTFFFKSLSSKLENVKSLFVSSRISKEHEYYTGFGDTITNTNFETWEIFIDGILKREEKFFTFDLGEVYDRVDYSLNFSGLLNSVEALSFQFPFRMKATQFTYSIAFDEIGQITLGYGHSSNSGKFEEFVNLVKRHILKSILEKADTGKFKKLG